jgi:phosphoglycolate phosphatase
MRHQPTIVFDWNCTLLDDMQLVVAATNVFLQHGGKPLIDAAAYQRHFIMPVTDFYHALGFAPAELTEKFLHLQNLFHDYYVRGEPLVGLRAGAHPLLKATEQHGINTIILSNHIAPQIISQLERLEITHHFPHVLAYADRATQFKHETKGQRLERFIAEHQLEPAQCVIIGDTAEEIHIARAYGLTSVAITGGFYSTERLQAEQPDHLVHDLHEFHTVLRQRGWAA